MTPTDKAAIEGLINRRIPAALKRITDGHGLMRVPAEDTDPDLVLADCLQALQRLLSGETREAVAWAVNCTNAPELICDVAYREEDIEELKEEWGNKAYPLYSSPSPHDDAGEDKPAGVPDAIKGYEQYPFAWHFGNIKVVLETMECTGKLPNGCPNCRGLSFCTKRDALKRYAKMEQCWNFWMEDTHHG